MGSDPFLRKKARKVPVVHTPEEVEKLVQAAAEILREYPRIPPLHLFRAAQDRALDVSRRRRTDAIARRVYDWLPAAARRRLKGGDAPVPGDTPGAGPGTEELEVIGRALGLLIEQVGERHGAVMEETGLIRRALEGLRRDFQVIGSEGARSGIEDTPLRGEIRELRREVRDLGSVVGSFRETLSRILGDLTGYTPEVKAEPPRTESPKLESPKPPKDKVRITVLGVKPDEVVRVKAAVNGSARLNIIPLDRQFDVQSVTSCDWVVFSHLVPHKTRNRIEAAIGTDRIRRPRTHGVGAVIREIQGLIEAAPV